MDLDKEFVRAVLAGGQPAYTRACEKGISAEYLFDEGKAAWEFIAEHKKKYGSIPSKEMIVGSVTKEGEPIDLSAGMADTFEALLDKVIERRVLEHMRQCAMTLGGHVSKRDARGAQEAFMEIHRKLQKEALTLSKVEGLFAMAHEIIAHYEELKLGKRGIPMPWPTLTEQTLGHQPEDLFIIVGRLGVGKTFSLLLLSHAAWVPGHKVLICTTEMSRRTLAERFMAIHLRIPYGDFRGGRLNAFLEERMKDGLLGLVKDQGIQIVGNDFDFSIDSLEGAVDEVKPELLAVDGAYLIKNVGKDRHEKVSNTFDDFKRIGKRKKIAVATATQFNRQAKAGQEESLSADNIGITDVAGWNADAAFAPYQTPEMAKEFVMGWKPLKIREGMPKPFKCNWNFRTMDFSEILDQSMPVSIQDNRVIPVSDDDDDGSRPLF